MRPSAGRASIRIALSGCSWIRAFWFALFSPTILVYEIADRAIRLLPERGRRLHIVAQNLIELWAVATRPVGNNGLGMSAAGAAAELDKIKGIFLFLPETPAIYPAWEALVRTYQVVGKPSHDARLAAAMQVHTITAILTFDKTGFSRYPAIKAIPPPTSDER